MYVLPADFWTVFVPRQIPPGKQQHSHSGKDFFQIWDFQQMFCFLLEACFLPVLFVLVFSHSQEMNVNTGLINLTLFPSGPRRSVFNRSEVYQSRQIITIIWSWGELWLVIWRDSGLWHRIPTTPLEKLYIHRPISKWGTLIGGGACCGSLLATGNICMNTKILPSGKKGGSNWGGLLILYPHQWWNLLWKPGCLHVHQVSAGILKFQDLKFEVWT